MTTVQPGREPYAGEPYPVPLVSTFLTPFWEEWSAAGSRWRRRIEQVQGGEGSTFLDLDGLLDPVRLFAVLD